MPSTLVGSPGTFTPKDRKSSNASSAISNGNKKGKNKGNPGQKSCRNYEEYLPLCEMQKGLEKGEIVEVGTPRDLVYIIFHIFGLFLGHFAH